LLLAERDEVPKLFERGGLHDRENSILQDN